MVEECGKWSRVGEVVEERFLQARGHGHMLRREEISGSQNFCGGRGGRREDEGQIKAEDSEGNVFITLEGCWLALGCERVLTSKGRSQLRHHYAPLTLQRPQGQRPCRPNGGALRKEGSG